MSSILTFVFGIIILGFFGAYFTTDLLARKRILGTVLTLLLVGFCFQQIWPPAVKIPLGLDLRGGSSFLIRLIHAPGEKITPDMLSQAVEVIRHRVDLFGVSEPMITPQGTDRILVQIPGLDTQRLEETKAQLRRVAKLEFASVHPNSMRLIPLIEAGDEILPPDYVIKKETFKDLEGRSHEAKYLVKKRPEISGDHVASAYAYFDQQGYGVSLRLNSEGARLFDELAEAHFEQPLAILLDGEIQSAPILKTRHFGGMAQITGNFTEKQARDLASILQNPLRVPVEIEETRSVSATLGRDSVHQGFVAGLTGLTLVMIFAAVYYRLAGVIALLGLMVNILLLLGMMAMFHFTLTLPGIAGIILTIGMAVDASVLIYERLREELAAGKSLGAALNGAYDKAFSAIFDANVTTLIMAIILFWQATGPVRGFAVTLTLGIVASMFSALICTRTVFRWMGDKGGLKQLRMCDMIPKRQFDFLGKRRWALAVSLFFLVSCTLVFAWRGKANFGIDFMGGDLTTVQYKQPVSLSEVRQALDRAGLGRTTSIQMEQGGGEKLILRSPQGTAPKVLNILSQAFPGRGYQVVQQDTVGAQIGAEFARKATFALALGMLAILIYVTLRFEFSFALGAVVALLHDIIITVGIFSLVGGKLSLVMVGAVLTIAGYSINDTIVVFDRIRERLRSRDPGTVDQLMNRSINETLGRTILTGGTTVLSVAALYFIGGEVLRDFAFAILVGILVGTYSSIFIAAPVVLWWSRFKKKSIRMEVIGDKEVKIV